MQTAPQTPTERLTEHFVRLGESVEACRFGNGGWLPAPLVALILSLISHLRADS